MRLALIILALTLACGRTTLVDPVASAPGVVVDSPTDGVWTPETEKPFPADPWTLHPTDAFERRDAR